MDDNELMARLARGDEDALTELIRRHRVWAAAQAKAILHDDSLAEDAAQEAFVRVYLLRDRYRPDFAFRTYLGVLVRRLAIDQLRRRKHQPTPAAYLPEALAESAEAAYLRDESRLRLWNELSALDGPDRALLIGFALEGCSYQELAQRQGLSLAQVRIRLHRIRKRLRQKERDGE